MPAVATLMDTYEPLFFNANFREEASEQGWSAYRGELVLKEGEVADALGRRKPPINLMRQAVLLTDGERIKLVSGLLDQLEEFPLFAEKFGSGLDADSIAVLFAVNIPEPFVATVNGASITFVPLVQGMTWNELIDMVALEKGDFKGLGAADKVITLYTALKNHKFKFAEKTLEQALATTNQARRETHGAV